MGDRCGLSCCRPPHDNKTTGAAGGCLVVVWRAELDAAMDKRMNAGLSAVVGKNSSRIWAQVCLRWWERTRYYRNICSCKLKGRMVSVVRTIFRDSLLDHCPLLLLHHIAHAHPTWSI